MDHYVITAQQRARTAQFWLTEAYRLLEQARQDFPPNAPLIAAREERVLRCEQWLGQCEHWLAGWEYRRDQGAGGPKSA